MYKRKQIAKQVRRWKAASLSLNCHLYNNYINKI